MKLTKALAALMCADNLRHSPVEIGTCDTQDFASCETVLLVQEISQERQALEDGRITCVRAWDDEVELKDPGDSASQAEAYEVRSWSCFSKIEVIKFRHIHHSTSRNCLELVDLPREGICRP